ncbi:MAG TPA: hypothetical protein DD379_25275 [Cyanobacteria bacterium UBA11162]|nr:hypothetical protein [Cyanobacteria bacterium UBA11162]
MYSLADTSIDPNAEDLHGHCITFWTLWQQYRGCLYLRCLRWMDGNDADAEEAISRASLKAWSKWLGYSGAIINPKAWLTRLTHNICMDMYRERNWGGQRVDSLEDIQCAEDEIVPSRAESLESALLHREKIAYLRHAIKALSPKLREPLVLHYYQEKSCREIAKQLNLSEERVWKRLQRGRAILKKQLNQYLSGVGNSARDSLQLLHSMPLTPESRDIPTLDVSITAESFVEPIDYRVTATCLETLPHAWYKSPNLKGWS